MRISYQLKDRKSRNHKALQESLHKAPKMLKRVAQVQMKMDLLLLPLMMGLPLLQILKDHHLQIMMNHHQGQVLKIMMKNLNLVKSHLKRKKKN